MGQKETLIISITVFFTIITWIMGDLYHVASTEKVQVKDRRYLTEIRIDIDKEVLQKLQEKQ